ncbi:MAG: tetratricopeptide repeat protein [bacterium]
MTAALIPSISRSIGAFQEGAAGGTDLAVVTMGAALVAAIAYLLIDLKLVKIPAISIHRAGERSGEGDGPAAQSPIQRFVSNELGIGFIAAVVVLLVDILFIRPAERQEIAKESAKQSEARMANTLSKVLDVKEKKRRRDPGEMSNPPGDMTVDTGRQRELESQLSSEKARRFTDLYQISFDLYQQGRFNESEQKFQEIVDEIGEIPEAYHGLGQALLGESRPDDALTAFQKASRLSPHNPDYRYHIANIYYGKGDYDGAVKECHALADLAPDDPAAHYYLGDAYYWRNAEGDMDAAVSELEKSLNINPRSSTAHNALGMAFLDKGQTSEAADEFNAAIGINSQCDWAYYNLARVDAILGNSSEAIAALDSAIRINADNLRYARDDRAFDSLRDNPDFKTLLSPNP